MTNFNEQTGEIKLTNSTSSQTDENKSKGSDDEFDVEKEMFELEQQLDIPSRMRWHNRTSSQTEISDEEIEKEGWKYCYENKISSTNIVHWITACKWYRKQLKQKYESS